MLAAAAGWRIVYVPGAISLERASATIADEAARRSRLIAGNWQATWKVLPALARRRPALACQVASHKATRPLVPWALLAIAGSTAVRAPAARWARWLAAAQGTLYAGALAGWQLERRGRRNRWLYLPYYFCRMNLAALDGLRKVLFEETGGVWQHVPRG
jgi:biofilm PGA synthesis N-glycosyltransferase PgaC